MKLVVQRVLEAEVRVGEESVGRVGRGMLVLLGVMQGDGEAQVRSLAEKLARFRFFPDERGRMNLSALDEGLEVLIVSQFTLAADGRKGRRPSFDKAAAPELAEPLYELFVAHLAELGLRTATGRFGAAMRIHILADGPVTFVLEEPPGSPAAPGQSSQV
ncbi:MAG: D-tyrosyl-tRNA(Tyr) deacylase [Planctomycetota bacterium]|jgi:D-tyrosyl-tRNA(Tyr) deacylase